MMGEAAQDKVEIGYGEDGGEAGGPDLPCADLEDAGEGPLLGAPEPRRACRPRRWRELGAAELDAAKPKSSGARGGGRRELAPRSEDPAAELAAPWPPAEPHCWRFLRSIEYGFRKCTESPL